MKIMLGFVVFLGVFIQSSTVSSAHLERRGQDAAFEVLPEDFRGIRLADIVVRSLGEHPRDLSKWGFGQVFMGVLLNLPMQLRDPQGIISVDYHLEGQRIYLYPKDHPEARVAFAQLGEARSGDEDTGRSGENHHWPLEFLISGLRIVREDSRKFEEYSILLPVPLESFLQTSAEVPGAPMDCSSALATAGAVTVGVHGGS